MLRHKAGHDFVSKSTQAAQSALYAARSATVDQDISDAGGPQIAKILCDLIGRALQRAFQIDLVWIAIRSIRAARHRDRGSSRV